MFGSAGSRERPALGEMAKLVDANNILSQSSGSEAASNP